MDENVNYDAAVEEINDGIVEEVHCIEDIDTASDFELKHTPNIEVIDGGDVQKIKVTIGLKGIAHPQTEEHLIEWIRLFDGSELVGTVVFGPEDTPIAEFELAQTGGQIIAQALCNLHGLWEARI